MKKSEALELLGQKIAACTRCQELTEWRTSSGWKTVPGVGNPNADLLILGEAPGADEAKQGIPFVGRAGQLLTKILEAAGWSRDDVFICNILKCRPPGNRDPLPKEAANCQEFLSLQIKCIDPKWIICFGRIASVYLLGHPPETTIASLRGGRWR
jgi:DNA polymerase